MTFAITATAEPTHAPPRIRLDVTESIPENTIQSVVLYRDGVKLRFDPLITGAGSALVYDTDANFDVALAYRADGIESGVSPDWAEPWPNLSAWSSPPGVAATGWAVAAGVASSTAADSVIYRDTSAAIVRLEVVNPSNVTVALADWLDTGLLSVITSPDGTVTVVGQGASNIVVGSGDYAIDIAESSASVVGSGWSATVPFASAPFYGQPTRVRLSGPGELTVVSRWVSANPGAVAMDSSDNAYVLDTVNNLVLKYDNTGALLASWSTTGTPSAIAVDSGAGFVYVADDTNTLIRKFTTAGVAVTTWSGAVEGGLAVGPSGNVHAVFGSTLTRYSPTGTVLATFSVGPATGSTIIRNLSVDSSGNVYTVNGIAGHATNVVRKRDSSGTFVTAWTAPTYLVALACNSSDVLYGVGNQEIYRFDSSGTLLSTDPTQGPVGAFAVYSATSDAYLSDATNGQLVRFTQDPGSVEDVTAYISADATFNVTASDTETLSPSGAAAGAWLGNAAQPLLSILAEPEPLSSDADYFIITSTRESSSLQANSVALPIEGSSEIVNVTTGPRRKEAWTLDVGCTTEAARQGLLALLADSAAVNLRLPSSARWSGLVPGFYAVGDVSSERRGHPQMGPIVIVSLPLTASRAPAYKSLWQWTAQALLQTGMSAQDVLNAFPTALDLLIGPI